MVVVAGARELPGRALAFARGPRQRIERGACALPCRIEVAAIQRAQRARGFEDCARLIRERLTARGGKSRRQPADRLELADQHSGRRRGGA
jgi:hypothetical protein